MILLICVVRIAFLQGKRTKSLVKVLATELGNAEGTGDPDKGIFSRLVRMKAWLEGFMRLEERR